MPKFTMIAGIAALGGLVAYAAPGLLNSSTACMKSRHYEIIKEETLTRLVAPASAEFPDLSKVRFVERDPLMDNCVFDVSGYVDAQNSYGAMIRSRISARTVGYDSGPSIIGLTLVKP